MRACWAAEQIDELDIKYLCNPLKVEDLRVWDGPGLKTAHVCSTQAGAFSDFRLFEAQFLTAVRDSLRYRAYIQRRRRAHMTNCSAE